MRAVGSELYRAGALQWELARLCSALALALEGNQLPLATGRPAFINAAGDSQGASLLSETEHVLCNASVCSSAVTIPGHVADCGADITTSVFSACRGTYSVIAR